MRCQTFVPSFLAVTLMMVPPSANAFLGCTDDAAGIQSQLTMATGNGEDDEIRIVAGTYYLTQHLDYFGVEAHALTISGGWNADCSAQDAGTTTLNAQELDQVMRIFTHAVSAIRVTRITFLNGRLPTSGSGYSSGLSIRSAGTVLVEANSFFLNRGNDDAVSGALEIEVEGNGTMTVRNNLIALNSAGYDAAGTFSAGTGDQYITGNTIVGNQATHATAQPTGGIYLADTVSAHFTLTNNLLWSNTGNDLYNNNDSTTLIHNDIGVLAGNAPDPVSNGNLAVEPNFAGGLLNFRLASRSPLVNAGINLPPGGAGAVDIAGAPRLQRPHIDIGAFESDVIFYGGFEPLP